MSASNLSRGDMVGDNNGPYAMASRPEWSGCESPEAMADSPIMNELLATRLRALVKADGRSAKQISRDARLYDEYVSQLQRGKIKMPSAEHLSAVAETLGVPLGKLIGTVEKGVPLMTKTPTPNEGISGIPGILKIPQYGARDLPIRGRAEGGARGVVMLGDNDPIDWAPRPAGLIGVSDAFGMFVTNDSMASAGLKNGTTISIHPHRRPSPTDFVVVVLTDGQALIKRLVKVSDTKVVVSQSDPPQEMTFKAEDVRHLYRVHSAEF